MADGQRSIEAELIRYRIEKRMAGRRDLLLHFLAYIGVALLFPLHVNWFTSPVDYYFVGGLWTIPLALHALRYYYCCCGRGLAGRADEIERAIDEQRGRTALDEDEELLIEERVSKRVTARRLIVAHALFSLMFLAVYLPYAFHYLGLVPDDVPGYLTAVFGGFGLVFVLHLTRFFFVHGRTPVGRALQIDAEIERVWHQSREQGRLAIHELEEERAALDLGEVRGRRLRLTADGEFGEEVDASSAKVVGAN
ncbi:MAG: hypothetical protein OXG85_02635 [Chloroflexi bacterium]|nr:hypothetical protein [Chloroflexota bacterium]